MPFNCLTEQDEELIQAYLDKFALGYDENPTSSRNRDLSYILRFWNQNKEDFLFKLLGGKLILEKEVHISKSPYELEGDMTEAFAHDKIFQELNKLYNRAIDNVATPGSDTWYNLAHVISTTTLAENSYNYTWKTFTVTIPETKKTFKVSPGMKPMKIISKLAEAYGFEEEFEKFRIAHSMMLNQKNLAGTLCLSIHPLDYMTMSDNDMDWDSCMNWREPGEYRQGTVEMMNSECVLVAYLKGSSPFNFAGNHYWNNKRWRSLVIANNRYTINVKGYPYQSEDLDTEVQKWIIELAKKNLNIDYAHHLEYDGEDVYECKTHKKLGGIYFMNGKMYNDFGTLRDDGCHMMAATNKDVENWHHQQYYSGPSECMWCGSECWEDDIEEGSVVCNSCGNVARCACCECRIDSTSSYEVEGELVCDDCYECHTSEDAFTGEIYYNNHVHKILLSPYKKGMVPDDVWAMPTIYIHRYHEDEEFKEFFKNGHDSVYTASVTYRYRVEYYRYVSVWDLTEEGLKIFDMSPGEAEEYRRDEEVPNSYTEDSLVDFRKKI